MSERCNKPICVEEAHIPERELVNDVKKRVRAEDLFKSLVSTERPV